VVTDIAVAVDRPSAALTAGRWLMFFTLFFLVLQTARDRQSVYTFADLTIVSAGAAGAVGVIGFLLAGGGRAHGPLGDPNDFAFLLATTVPLALWRVRWPRSRGHRYISMLALLCMTLAVATTLSRGAGVALAVAAVWAIIGRRVRLRWLAIGAIASVLGLAALAVGDTGAVTSAVSTKQQVASSNVSSRLYYWQVALDELGANPLTGVGPGNFQTRFSDFALPYDFSAGDQTTHDTYLNVAAELGLPGAFLFFTFLIISWKTLRVRWASRFEDEFQSALAAGFIVALVGSLFLTEEFYAPLWLLSAFAASTAAGLDTASAGVRRTRLLGSTASRLRLARAPLTWESTRG
jgi:O-antigen ligase